MEDLLSDRSGSGKATQTGQFEGKFLIAMPNMDCDVFGRSIIYICAHSDEGAMGFQINKSGDLTLQDIIKSSDLGVDQLIEVKAKGDCKALVRNGGPVDENRGFVLHSADYDSEATIPISEKVYLTSNLTILRSIAEGDGPQKMAIALGYAGWGPGQLEAEFADNAWLSVDADPNVVFDPANDGKYEKMLAAIGITDANFVTDIGHA